MSGSGAHLSHPKYRPDIDGLRAIAVLSVVAFHAFPKQMPGGFIGVDVFFVISGFLISTIILENLDRGSFRFAEFYARRVRRIFPALVVVLLACLLFGWNSLLADELNQFGKHVAAGSGFVSNWVLWSEAGYFDTSAENKPLLHLWSLGIEEQFYIVWPVILFWTWKRKVSPLLLVLLLTAASFGLNAWAIYQDAVATFYSPVTRFWELLCGALLAWHALRSPKDSTQRWSANLYSVAGLSLLAVGFWVTSKESRFPGFWALIPVCGAVLIILAGPQSVLNRRLLSQKVMVWFGLISFPLYLWHWPLLSFGRIIYFDPPPLYFRVGAVLASIELAWLTSKFIERPLRFGSAHSRFKVAALVGMIAALAIAGLALAATDFTRTHTYDKLRIKRRGEHAIGDSLAWYRGKDDWLFLGNAYDSTVAKLKGKITPSEEQIAAVTRDFANVTAAAATHRTAIVLFVGPNKSSMYPEYLPDSITPATWKYSHFFLDKLREVSNLTVYDPTDALLSAKATEGLLYWRTDTHWNQKGAFLAYSGFARLMNLPIPSVEFKPGAPRGGDLIGISKMKDFPLRADDNWDAVWRVTPAWKEKVSRNEQKTSFGTATIITNPKPLTDKIVWVVGDSFAEALKPYFNASFKEVHYKGHWRNKLKGLPAEFLVANPKPDMIIIVRVEREF